MKRLLLLSFFTAAVSPMQAQLSPNGATASFKGSLPPKPTAALSSEQEAAIEKELAAVTQAFAAVKKHARAADAEIFLKAVRYALEFDEWYDKKPEDGVKKATALLDEAKKRIESLTKNETPWMNGSGLKVLGFYSKIDDSPQPYGVEVPEGLEFGAGKKPVPMWIWLHGRGDTATDLPFVYSRLMAKKPGQFQPAGTIVIHPFGRYCNGWKSAGETDVFECRDDATKRFNIDTNRIALAGFSMGGAGAWHLGAHYADQWACVHTGAGFADVKRYQKLTPDKYPAWYEQKLWGVYDVPDYARNFFNVPLISYSGELDAQRDSAEYMIEVLGKEGLHPPHLIGPGMPHKYHPETLKEVQAWIEKAVAKGRDLFPDEVHIQTKTPFYGRMKWMNLHGLEESWKEARLDAKVADGQTIEIKTSHVTRIVFYPPPQARKGGGSLKVIVDGAELKLTVGPELPQFETFMSPGPKVPGSMCRLIKENGVWRDFGNEQPFQHEGPQGGKPSSHPGLMDMAFLKRFLVVLPDGKSSSPAVDAWVAAESAHFLTRWRSLMRGDARVVKASEIKDVIEAGKTQSLILWGTPESNSCLKQLAAALPVQWSAEKVGLGGRSFDARTHVPLLTYPCLQSPGFEVVINSGLTFREAHDRTNSLQNPKLPDWAILDITQPPNAETAGKVVAADFFDERWQVRKK
ncbi:prolyl oligopeptidase family serine peptidase [Prosthecobacter sp.]|uniref:prolyl oligopeptidase family serine peptidase n=1 Tax=Prosthecobacter sp. TaxID=1965333 RepID=UPI002ABCF9D6|nr:prolyl oligopeptidase family serine peptidase [Prosthecobacter sp.]MDZ4401102.1 prolyl oligopeptidase family serine peptidase [Prosthecobacter sp.]